MQNHYDVTEPIYDALDIALRYFERQGLFALALKYALAAHICSMFNGGEKRILMLANRAIDKAERDRLAEQEIHAASLIPFFYLNG